MYSNLNICAKLEKDHVLEVHSLILYCHIL